MHHIIKSGAAAFVVLAAIVPATAQTTTTTVIERRGPVVLTPEQRTIIYRSVTRERQLRPLTGVEVTAGARLPATVELSTLPEDVYVEVPAIKRYRYVYVQNQVVLVDPDTSEVVEVIAR